MSDAKSRIQLHLGERLRESERRATSMSLPVAIQHKLDQLAERAKDLDATRAEIIGMLIARADFAEEELELALLRYRKLKVEDVLWAEESDLRSNVISIRPRGPGRPAKSGNS